MELKPSEIVPDDLINIPEGEVVGISSEGELVRRIDTLREYVDEWIVKYDKQIFASLEKKEEPVEEVIQILRKVCESDALLAELRQKNKELNYFWLSTLTWMLQGALLHFDQTNPNVLPNTDEFTVAFVFVFLIAFSLSVLYSEKLGDLGNRDEPEEVQRLKHSIKDNKVHIEVFARKEGLVKSGADADKILQELSSSLQRNYSDFYRQYAQHTTEEEKKKKKKNS